MSIRKQAVGFFTIAILASMSHFVPVHAAVQNGWEVVDGNYYWYEEGVKQGTEGRGKEIYDPESDAWYWLDAVDGGKKATNKDLYQESEAGEWAEKEDGTGKWVRYDENGHMVKGWYTNEKGTYYFDHTYGTMAKGDVTIEGKAYSFDKATGILLGERENADANGWVTMDGIEYWYENGVRQGTEGRGKEIYDPGSDAWYWLDAVDGGKKAVSKDVYQESLAGSWGDIVGEDGQRYGKWVRYDENGHMIKGWNTNDKGTYYFDLVYGTMAKGNAVIDGVTYYFDVNTGICQGEVEEGLNWYNIETVLYNSDGTIATNAIVEYEENGDVKITTYQGDFIYEVITFRHSADGKQLCYQCTRYARVLEEGTEDEYTTYKSYEYTEYEENGICTDYVKTYYDKDGNVTSRIDGECDDNGNTVKKTETVDGEVRYITEYVYQNGNLQYDQIIDVKENYIDERNEYIYDENGCLIEKTNYEAFGEDKNLRLEIKWIFKYDANGNRVREDSYVYNWADGKERRLIMAAEMSYVEIDGVYYQSEVMQYGFRRIVDEESGSLILSEVGEHDVSYYTGGYKYVYDEDGNEIEYYYYTNNSDYQKVLDYYIIYHNDILDEAEELGQKQTIKYETVYNNDDSIRSYQEQVYEVKSDKYYGYTVTF